MLACARRLTQSGIACTVLEGSDDVGGRVRLGTAADHIGGTSLVLESGERLAGDVLVIATDYATAARIRGERAPLGA